MKNELLPLLDKYLADRGIDIDIDGDLRILGVSVELCKELGFSIPGLPEDKPEMYVHFFSPNWMIW